MNQQASYDAHMPNKALKEAAFGTLSPLEIQRHCFE